MKSPFIYMNVFAELVKVCKY